MTELPVMWNIQLALKENPRWQAPNNLFDMMFEDEKEKKCSHVYFANAFQIFGNEPYGAVWNKIFAKADYMLLFLK